MTGSELRDRIALAREAIENNIREFDDRIAGTGWGIGFDKGVVSGLALAAKLIDGATQAKKQGNLTE